MLTILIHIIIEAIVFYLIGVLGNSYVNSTNDYEYHHGIKPYINHWNPDKWDSFILRIILIVFACMASLTVIILTP